MDPAMILIGMAVILPALTVHEFAHAYSALRLGDPTPQMLGRVTLNPAAHIDPFGTILLPFLLVLSGLPPFGWAKPVPVNPLNFRRPGRDDIIVSAAGPLANLALALVSAILLRVVIALAGAALRPTSLVLDLLFSMVEVNIVLAFFNLIPLGPLDGHHIVENALPYPYNARYRELNRYGFLVLFVIIFLFRGVLSTLVFSPAYQLTALLTGVRA